MQRAIGSFWLDRCMQVTEMKNDVQDIQREVTRAFDHQIGTAGGIGRRFAEQGPHLMAGEK